MYNTTITIIWLISLIICGVLSYLAGKGSMRIIEITSNESLRELPGYGSSELTEMYKQYYGADEAAYVPGDPDPDQTTEEKKKNILYKTFGDLE